jgi:radical SAM superfamily enzyme YgiQ (UPF0313 family)
MRVLLINPDSELSIKSKVYRRAVAPVLPMGIAYVAAVLEKEGIAVAIEDQYASKISNDELLDRISKTAPEIVGISCLTANMSNVKTIVLKLRESHPDIRIVLGNIHATLFSEQLLRDNLADAVVRGEGEYSMLEVARAMERKCELRNIDGVSYREQDGSVVHNHPRAPVDDLDCLPHPAWHLFDLTRYTRYPLLGINREVVIPVLASRGCPYRCVFCSQDKLYDRPRYRNTEKVLDEVEEILEKYRVRFVGFNDAFFPFSVKHGMDFTDQLMKRGLHRKLKWITETRVDKVDLNLLKKMKESGAHLIMYGFEVGNQRILDMVNKQTTVQQAEEAMRNTKIAGIRTLGLFMLGLPGETREDCEKTILFAKKLDSDIVKFNIAIPQPGSRLFETVKRDSGGIPDTDRYTSWSDWTDPAGEVSCSASSIGFKELVYLQRKAMFVYYFRLNLILRHLIRGTFPLRDLCFGAHVLLKNYFASLSSRFRST